MAKKRFTDIEIWDREWYMDLTPTHKCLIKYIFDKCDASGCWKPNWKLASYHINDKVCLEDLKLLPSDQYEILANGKIFIPDFVGFQYGKLSKECRPHIPIIALIEKNDLSDRFYDFIEEKGSSVKDLRKRLTEPYKKEIFEQDGYKCQYCGIRPELENIFIDHIVSLSKGGDNLPENLTTSCKSCNSKKGIIDVFDFLDKFKLKPLGNLSKKLDTLSKKLDTLEEKEKDMDMDIDKEKEKEKEGNQQKKINGNHILESSNLFRKPNVPTYEKVHMVFLQNGGTEEMAKTFFNTNEGVDWFRNGSPITNFSNLVPSYVETWRKNENKKNGSVLESQPKIKLK